MPTPTVGEIRLFAFSRTPVGWLPCDGSQQAISEHEALFTLIGTTYGGDGARTFATPDLRGRVPVGQGTGPNIATKIMGIPGGSETVALQPQHMARHSHPFVVSTALAKSNDPSGRLLGAPANEDKMYTSKIDGLTPQVTGTGSTTVAGGGQSHDNLMPTLTVAFCICADGVFPSRS
ncbi:MAG TPA: tail fiber protein [Herbaspirillum sp.]|jgi:microcystin-dependent protein